MFKINWTNTKFREKVAFLRDLTPIKFRLPLIFAPGGRTLKGANWPPKLGEGRKLKGANWPPKVGGAKIKGSELGTGKGSI